ncbi:GAF domain-containing protein [Duganella sp. FT92W]|uniref:GAF domain-containing protein n=1 Tax=Pseudoduganella rivuli TaxID=2666085 RepID=A0A7X2IK68_9BURK|nr:GAF domain-containing protein [Pseudoduganella rivuli]MRV71517.1 GAF domain-containing protein [Pseudoduganella rivuli]
MTSAEDSLYFFKRLQQLTNKIHATHDIDDIMLDMSAELCELFAGDRLTVYQLSEDKASMVSKVKTGLASFKQLKLPISKQSIAGYAALSGRMLNLLDVYDEAELRRVDPELSFQQGVDRRTGYRTQQMLAAPIIDERGAVQGVLQLINNRKGGPFDALVEEGVQHICDSLAIAMLNSQKTPARERGRFAAMLPETVVPRAQLELAMHSAAARRIDIEDVLLDELAIPPPLVGRALADFFGVPYFMFQVDRRRPPGLLDNFNREYVMQHQWMPLEESRNGLYVLAVDPDQLKASGAVQRVFPHAVPIYCVTTRREFGWMINQFFGAAAPETPPESTIPPPAVVIVPGADPAFDPNATQIQAPALPWPPHSPAAVPAQPAVDQTLIGNAVAHIVQMASQSGISELHITTTQGENGEIRFTVTGALHPRG